MRAFALAFAVVSIAGGAHAGPAPAWVTDKAASSIRFSSTFDGAPFAGRFSRWNADIRFDPANLGGSAVTVTIDTASVATGDADRDQALPTPTFLSVARFPQATFTAHAFTALGGNRYQAIGELTLRGVTRPLTLPFNLATTGPQARMTATLTLNRLAYGVGQDEWAKVDTLPAAVNVAIALTARRR